MFSALVLKTIWTTVGTVIGAPASRNSRRAIRRAQACSRAVCLWRKPGSRSSKRWCTDIVPQRRSRGTLATFLRAVRDFEDRRLGVAISFSPPVGVEDPRVFSASDHLSQLSAAEGVALRANRV